MTENSPPGTRMIQLPVRFQRPARCFVQRDAAVDPVTMNEAQRIAGEVYHRAGIEIEWLEQSTYEDATRLWVNVLSAEMAIRSPASTETVGCATPGSRAANVFQERIRVIARRHHVECGVLLGYVIAHELGHLLLPAHSHSDLGVMRPNLDLELAATNKLRFTIDQVALIQERLTCRRQSRHSESAALATSALHGGRTTPELL